MSPATAASSSQGDALSSSSPIIHSNPALMEHQHDVESACPIDRQWIAKLLQQNPNPNTPPQYHDKALVVAPMVDQSDLPFRLQCRKYGSNLAFTPMIHAGMFCKSEEYRARFLPKVVPEDRPVIAQICGSDPRQVEQTAKQVLPYVDGIDLNCGCPQAIAKRGNYGAFLLEQEEVLIPLVRHMVRTISKPVSVKVRLLPGDAQHSLDLYTKLVNCGIHLLTIHGRTRHQKGHDTGSADWTVIKTVVETFGHKIPIFANGSIGNLEDVQKCLEATGVDGVMSSEAILEYPAIFYQPEPHQPQRIGRLQLAREYLALATQHPPDLGGQGSGLKTLRAHIHRFLHEDLEIDQDLRQRVAKAATIPVLYEICNEVERQQQEHQHKVEEEQMCWYMRHRKLVSDEHGNIVTAMELKRRKDQGLLHITGGGDSDEEEDEDNACALFDADDGGDY